MKSRLTHPACISAMAVAIVVAAGASSGPAVAPASAAPAAACPGGDTGITLSPGFCATVFADNLGHVRHLVVTADGTVYANSWSGRYYHNDTPPSGGFLLALKDSGKTGHADSVKRFGEGVPEGAAGGTGIAFYNHAIYAEVNDRIVRYALNAGETVPSGKPETILSGMPLVGDHPMHPFVIDAQGKIYVDIGSATNACDARNRMPMSPGNDPCTELQTRGGIWRYDANRTGQKFSPAERYATGIRNGEGLSFDRSAPSARCHPWAAPSCRQRTSPPWRRTSGPSVSPARTESPESSPCAGNGCARSATTAPRRARPALPA
jgi:glucose/arabinose dehydrogenase